jgi:hypothetical protein
VGFHSDWASGIIFDVLGVAPSTWDHTGHSESAAALVLGKLDAYFASAAPPHPTLAQTDLTNPIRLLKFTEEDMDKVKANTSFQFYYVEAGTYRGMDVASYTPEDPWVYACRTDLPEDLAYDLAKSYYENPEFLGNIYAAAEREIVQGRVKNWTENVVTAPYHIGSYRYFQELGWDIPEAMIPPEAK